ncbi:MAG: L,D-transpeptidase family protein [Proteobacteria bacterium]|nr:L,D-transpeptidase family protein [Pseudomonadota bacterium]
MNISEILLLKKIRIPVLIFFLSISASCGTDAFAKDLNELITEALCERFIFSKYPHQVICIGDQLCVSKDLPRFYGLRGFSPAWITDKGVSTQTHELIRTIRKAADEGINPLDYHIDGIEILLKEITGSYLKIDDVPIKKLMELELLLSDAFFLYASHLTAGRVNPETIQKEWAIKNQHMDLVRILFDSLDKGNISYALETVNQQSPDYQRLKKASESYRKLAENAGWPHIPKGPKMKKGDRGARIAILHSHLKISGDLGQTDEKNPRLFGDILEKAVLRFQKRHGLTEDGVVGRATITALNITALDRLKQIVVNMERWRWLQRDFGPRYIVVNIADFQLNVVEENESILKMRVVVGKYYRQTPVLEGKMTYLVINPFWIIPQKLAEEDMLPLIKEDKEVIKSKKIRVYESWKNGALEIDPGLVNWKIVNNNGFSYKLVQEPGPLNALGHIKFIFPNKFDVYFHDTPARDLFNREKRDFSSGCIRIEKPVELAAYLLQVDTNWTKQKLLEAIDSQKTQIISLSNPIAVKILYFTAWVDEQGIVNFRNDIYQWDKQLAEALEEKTPYQQDVNKR